MKKRRPKERQNIIKRVHQMGHFQVDATEKKVRQNYHWKTLKQNIE